MCITMTRYKINLCHNDKVSDAKVRCGLTPYPLSLISSIIVVERRKYVRDYMPPGFSSTAEPPMKLVLAHPTHWRYSRMSGHNGGHRGLDKQQK